MQSYPHSRTEVSGIDSGFYVTRADMESAHGAPIGTSGRQAAGSVIGVNPCGCDPSSHDRRSVSKQTQGEVEQGHGFSFQAAMAKAVRVSFFSCRGWGLPNGVWSRSTG